MDPGRTPHSGQNQSNQHAVSGHTNIDVLSQTFLNNPGSSSMGSSNIQSNIAQHAPPPIFPPFSNISHVSDSFHFGGGPPLMPLSHNFNTSGHPPQGQSSQLPPPLFHLPPPPLPSSQIPPPPPTSYLPLPSHLPPPYPQPPSQQPSYHQSPSQQPSYHEPPSQQPSYHEPPSQQPSYHQSPSQQPSYHQSPSQQPSYHQPPFHQPPSQQPPSQQPPPLPQSCFTSTDVSPSTFHPMHASTQAFVRPATQLLKYNPSGTAADFQMTPALERPRIMGRQSDHSNLSQSGSHSNLSQSGSHGNLSQSGSASSVSSHGTSNHRNLNQVQSSASESATENVPSEVDRKRNADKMFILKLLQREGLSSNKAHQKQCQVNEPDMLVAITETQQDMFAALEAVEFLKSALNQLESWELEPAAVEIGEVTSTALKAREVTPITVKDSAVSVACEHIDASVTAHSSGITSDKRRLLQKIQEAKNITSNVLNKYEDKAVINTVLKKLTRNKKRRTRFKHARRQTYKERKLMKQSWKVQEAAVDAWQASLAKEIEEKKKAAQVKAIADETLAEVRLKNLEILKAIKSVHSLKKLRAARKHSAEQKGFAKEIVSDDEAFAYQCEKLLDMLHGQKKLYDREQQTLEVMLEEEVEENKEIETKARNLKLKTQVLKYEKELRKYLFGCQDIDSYLKPFHEFYTQAESDVESLVHVRCSWDQYLLPANVAGGSAIPLHWVCPSEPSNELWEGYLEK